MLKARPDIDARQIGLVGISQAGWAMPRVLATHRPAPGAPLSSGSWTRTGRPRAADPVRDDARERAWAAVHDSIARMPGWAVGPSTHRGEGTTWYVSAVGLRRRGRQATREAIAATETTETATLGALAVLLDARD